MKLIKFHIYIRCISHIINRDIIFIGSGILKTLLLIHSCNGILQEVSKKLQKKIGCEVLKINDIELSIYDKKNKYKKFYNDKLLLEEIKENLNGYERVIMIIPSWFYNKPLGIKRSTFGNDLNGKNILLITVGSGKKNYDKEKLFLGMNITKEMFVNIKDIKNEQFYTDVINWLNDL